MHIFQVLEELSDYCAERKIDGYLVVAIHNEETFVDFGYTKSPDVLLDVVDGMLVDIEMSRPKDD
jgi:hypothetical protein